MPLSAVLVLLILGALLGALIGWIWSLVSRTETNAAIYLVIAIGAAGGIVGPLVVGLNSSVDSVLASTLAASALLTLFAVGEKHIQPPASQSPEQRHDNQPHTVPAEIVEEEQICAAEEHMKAGKTVVDEGGVQVRSFVEERSVRVTLREEHLSVERRRVDQPLSSRDLASRNLLGAQRRNASRRRNRRNVAKAGAGAARTRRR